MARQSFAELVIRTAVRGVVYFLAYKTMKRVWDSDHPILYSVLILAALALVYYVQ
jgi:hypothetical protein